MTKTKVSLATIILVAISLILLSYFSLNTYKDNSQLNKVNKGQILGVEKEGATLPARLKIPKLGVDAVVQHLGITPDGAMDVPTNTADVGWYQLGPIPGSIGSAVISGHLDDRKGKNGVFNDLDKLKPGDQIEVINNKGLKITFQVRESKTYNPGQAPEVFISNDNGKHLNLVTCIGTWDKAKKSYTKRLVVFADLL